MSKSEKSPATKVKINDSFSGISKIKPEKGQNGQGQGNSGNTPKK